MSIRLRLISVWIPEFILIKELERSSNLIDQSLTKLLNKYNISEPFIKTDTGGSLGDCIAIMAESQNIKVNALVEFLGLEKSLEVGRAEMFEVGYIMGVRAKNLLGVGENINDAIAAAKILYKIFGIEFTVDKDRNNILLKVKSCSLAAKYSPETCKIMSAIDEGVLKGLNEKTSMKFIKRITEGADECEACINIEHH